MTLYLTDSDAAGRDARARARPASSRSSSTPPARRPTATPASPTCARSPATLEAAEREGIILLVHGEVTDPDGRRVRSRGGLHRAPPRAAAARLPGLKIVLEHVTTQRGRAVRRRGRRPHGGDDHRAPPALQPQRALHRRHPAALLLPAGAQARGAPPRPGRGGDLGQRALLPRHRQRAASCRAEGARERLRRLLHRASARSSCTPRRSRPPARSTGSSTSPASPAPTSTACRRNAGTVTLQQARPGRCPRRCPSARPSSSRCAPARRSPGGSPLTLAAERRMIDKPPRIALLIDADNSPAAKIGAHPQRALDLRRDEHPARLRQLEEAGAARLGGACCTSTRSGRCSSSTTPRARTRATWRWSSTRSTCSTPTAPRRSASSRPMPTSRRS